MVTCCFRVMTFLSFAISVWDFVTDIMATYDFWQTMEGYRDNADVINAELTGDQDSNFKADSTWFAAVSAEYDALSSFDKENVYCDIHSLQADPKSLLDTTEHIFYAACVFIVLSVIALVLGYRVLWQLVRSGDIVNNEGLTKNREMLWTFNSKSAIQFCEVGPQLALLAMMIVRVGKLDGYKCQDKFYNCGVAGDCSMKDMMVSVPLNSSLLDIASSDTFLALSFGAGLIDLFWNFGSGVFLFCSKGAPRLVVMPFIQLSLGLLPVMWVIYIDGLIPTGRTSDTDGIIAIAVTIFVSLCFCCSAGVFLFFAMTDSVLVNEVKGLNNNTPSGLPRGRGSVAF